MKHARRTSKPDRSLRRRRFTLLELLVAMAILILLLGMTMRILSAGQKAQTAVETSSRIYENARATLEIITRDLQSARASAINGEEIGFCMVATGGGHIMAFGAMVSDHPTANTRLCEIVYQVDGTSLYRTCIPAQDSGGADVSEWDLVGTTDEDWVDDDLAMGEVLCQGVAQWQLSLFDALGNDITPASGDTECFFELPASVTLNLTLYDPKPEESGGATALITQRRTETQRTFSRTVFLRAR